MNKNYIKLNIKMKITFVDTFSLPTDTTYVINPDIGSIVSLITMEYNIIVAPTLETLATEVAVLFPQGWKLKGGIIEHHNGFSQQLVRKPSDKLKIQRQAPAASNQRRTKWIE